MASTLHKELEAGSGKRDLPQGRTSWLSSVKQIYTDIHEIRISEKEVIYLKKEKGVVCGSLRVRNRKGEIFNLEYNFKIKINNKIIYILKYGTFTQLNII